jgi:hypothetical protein
MPSTQSKNCNISSLSHKNKNHIQIRKKTNTFINLKKSKKQKFTVVVVHGVGSVETYGRSLELPFFLLLVFYVFFFFLNLYKSILLFLFYFWYKEGTLQLSVNL